MCSGRSHLDRDATKKARNTTLGRRCEREPLHLTDVKARVRELLEVWNQVTIRH